MNWTIQSSLARRGRVGTALAVVFLLAAIRMEAGDLADAEPASFGSRFEVPGSMSGSGVLAEGLDSALRQSREAIESRNLLKETERPEREAARLREFRERLELARRQRLEMDFRQAERGLIGLLEGESPIEIRRSALLELALLARDNEQPARAQQIYTQYVRKFSNDPNVPEVLLRQGLLYREMGAPVLALSKFYGVISSSLHLSPDWLEYYQKLVLLAQTEIADTYYLQGKFEEAGDFFNRILKLDHTELNKPAIHAKLVRCHSALGHHREAIAEAERFIGLHPNAPDASEVRFVLADSLMHLGRRQEARRQVLALLEAEHSEAGRNPDNWLYWQHRAGNKIANDFYREGDYLNALEIYLALGRINDAPNWQLPVWYQAALIHERLEQPDQAGDLYARILDRRDELDAAGVPGSLGVVLDMAERRRKHLEWRARAETTVRQLTAPNDVSR